jgi:flavin-binding protein dodecin
MTMLKVIEVLAESPKSWEDAAQQAVGNASKTVRNVKPKLPRAAPRRE